MEDCKYIEDVLDLPKRNDDYFYTYFYVLCIGSGYREVMPRIEAFVERIGRMLYVIPIMRALIETDWGRGRARPLLERVREKHHPVTVNAMQVLLKKAGL